MCRGAAVYCPTPQPFSLDAVHTSKFLVQLELESGSVAFLATSLTTQMAASIRKLSLDPLTGTKVAGAPDNKMPF